MPLPRDVQHRLQQRLNQIGEEFLQPKITLVVRAPQLDDGDLVMTNDDPAKAIAAIERLVARGADNG